MFKQINYKYKTGILLILFGLLLSSNLPQKKPSTLKIDAKFIAEEVGGISYTQVNIYNNSKLLERIFSDGDGNISFNLNYGQDYIIEVVRKEYIKQQITISTKVPENYFANTNIPAAYSLEIKMYPSIEGVDVSFFKKPVLRYIINPKKQSLVTDAEYYKSINYDAQIKELLKQTEKIKEKLYLNEIATAESLIILNNYEKAWQIYHKVLNYSENNKVALARIKEIERFILLNKDISNDNDNTMNTADSLLAANDLETAEGYYVTSLLYSTDIDYINKKLFEIDSIQNKTYVKKYNRYKDLVDEGTQLVNQQDFTKAKDRYEEAEKIMSSISKTSTEVSDVQVSIRSIDEKEKLQQLKLQKEYNSIIKDADSLLNSGHFEPARRLYLKATNLKPDEEYPKIKAGTISNFLLYKDSIDNENNKTAQLLSDYELKINFLQKENKELASEKTLLTNRITEKEEQKEEQKFKNQEAHKLQIKLLNDSIKKVLSVLDDTIKKIDKLNNDSLKSKAYNDAGTGFLENQLFSKAIDSYEKSFEINQAAGKTDEASNALENIAKAYYDSGVYTKTIQTLEQSAKLKLESGNKKGATDILFNIGSIYENTYDYDKAVNFYEQSLEEKKQLNDVKSTAEITTNVAEIFYKQKNLEKAIESYKSSIDLNTKLENKDELGKVYNNLGIAYLEKGDFESASTQFEKALEMNEELGKSKESSIVLNNIGNAKYEENKFRKAIDFYEKSLELKDNVNYEAGFALSLSNIGNAYRQLNNYKKAIEYFERSNEISEKNDYESLLSRNYKALLTIYESTGDKKNTEKYSEILKGYDDVVVNIDEQMGEREEIKASKENYGIIKSLSEEIKKQKELAEQEIQKREQELVLERMKVRNKTIQLKKQRIFSMSLSGGIVLAVLAALIILRQLTQKKKAYAQLFASNRIITNQKKQITDNIHSASRIQNAALPPYEFLNNAVEEFFILNRPRDIVSGDFYWAGSVNNKISIAVADCTGHGVQGAVMSMLGMAFLNEIAHKHPDYKPSDVLNELRNKIIGSLHTTAENEEVVEGMDMVFCNIDRENLTVEYCGAKNPILLSHKNEIKIFPGDRARIGFELRLKEFNTNIIPVAKGDTIYMFSDGYIDQLGGDNRKRFSRKRFIELLQEINDKPMNDRKRLLEEELERWIGNNDQVDDILVMGITI